MIRLLHSAALIACILQHQHSVNAFTFPHKSTVTTTRRIASYHVNNRQSQQIQKPQSYSTTTTSLCVQSNDRVNNNSLQTVNNDNSVGNSIWESIAASLVDINADPANISLYMQTISVIRVVTPAAALALLSNIFYPLVATTLAEQLLHNDSGIFAVVSQDASQYIQNILTTSGLVFSLLTGQTYYFLYQQQEAIYLALFEEVTMTKSLLEQVALVSQGRQTLYKRILLCVDRYVKQDLMRFNDVEPATILSSRPVDDPLEDILYLTSVGEPSIIYSTVKSLRTARAYRLGALQRKLPPIHTILLYSLAAIVLFTFPLLGAGSQTIGGEGILRVQAWFLSFIVFGIWLTLGVIGELQRTGDNGAYNARAVLSVMVAGLQQELEQRLEGKIAMTSILDPSIDADGYEFEE